MSPKYTFFNMRNYFSAFFNNVVVYFLGKVWFSNDGRDSYKNYKAFSDFTNDAIFYADTGICYSLYNKFHDTTALSFYCLLSTFSSASFVVLSTLSTWSDGCCTSFLNLNLKKLFFLLFIFVGTKVSIFSI